MPWARKRLSGQPKLDQKPESLVVAAGRIKPAKRFAHLSGAAESIGQGVAIAEVLELDRVDRLDGERKGIAAGPHPRAIPPADRRPLAPRADGAEILPLEKQKRHGLHPWRLPARRLLVDDDVVR